MGIAIRGTGTCIPKRVLRNADLEKMVDTNDDWIVSRTGIRERRIAEKESATSDLAWEAARNALKNADWTPEMLDLIVVATITPDKMTPCTASIVQNKLGAPFTCMCFDIEAACAGLLYGMEVVHALLASGARHHALVIGADKLTSVTNWTDRSTCVLFGDAGAALAIEASPSIKGDFLVGSVLGVNGGLGSILQIPAGGSAFPASEETVEQHKHAITMNGPKTYQMAVTSMTDACRKVLEKTGIRPEEIRWAVPHQANSRIIDAVAERLNMQDKIYKNVDRFGNTSSASVGICLDELNRSGKLQAGDKVLTAAFGAGLVWAAQIIRW